MTTRRSPLVVLIATIALLLVGQPAFSADWVERSQKRLNSLGCSAGPADGVVGERTRSALVRFQAANRLTQTGRFNPTTRERLKSDKARRCDVRRVPAKSGQGRRIVLSQRQNYVWLVRKNGTVRAQGGIIDNPSYLSRGTHYTGSLCGRPGRVARNSDYGGSLWLYNFVRFAPCGVGFHRVPVYKSNGRQIHPNHLLGTDYRESHGCIRLSRRMSERVWDFTSRRTKVVVVRG
ncbi:MAG TPA: L,D-transpeptidase family protein [Nocardioidaceae bacterium]